MSGRVGSLLIQPFETVSADVQPFPVNVVLVVAMMPDWLHAVFRGERMTDIISNL